MYDKRNTYEKFAIKFLSCAGSPRYGVIVSEVKYPKPKTLKATFQNAQALEMEPLFSGASSSLFMRNGSLKLSTPSGTFCYLHNDAFLQF